MHVLDSDEIFHFYLGDPVEMLQLYPDGRSVLFTLGSDLQARAARPSRRSGRGLAGDAADRRRQNGAYWPAPSRLALTSADYHNGKFADLASCKWPDQTEADSGFDIEASKVGRNNTRR